MQYGQFATILSLNKTMEKRWGQCFCAHFSVSVIGGKMKKRTKNLTYAAVIAALYDHFTDPLGSAHDIGGIHRFIGGNENKFYRSVFFIISF